ncbi:MAG: nucleotide exchange factor GrpE [Fuerstiella sp.]
MSTTENHNEHNFNQDDAAAAAADAAAADRSAGESPPADEIGRLREENAELQDRVLRIQAELENFRRRSQREAADATRYQSLSVIRDMLPGIDNLKRAIDAAEQSGDTQNLIDGIRMVASQFHDVLKQHSAEVINPEGQSFDPNLHEALSQVPSADHEPMSVFQVIEPGYRIHDRVIRPAKVIVTCAPPQAGPADSDNDRGDQP